MLGYYLRLALRSFARTPGLTVLTIGAIATGIAVSVITFSLYHLLSGNPIRRTIVGVLGPWSPLPKFHDVVCLMNVAGLLLSKFLNRATFSGIRRALGASRRQLFLQHLVEAAVLAAIGALIGIIVAEYCLLESGLVSTAGNLVGTCLALGAGYWMTVQNQFPRLNVFYLVGAMMALWVIGQLAAWRPAKRAAAVSPAVATRTV